MERKRERNAFCFPFCASNVRFISRIPAKRDFPCEIDSSPAICEGVSFHSQLSSTALACAACVFHPDLEFLFRLMNYFVCLFSCCLSRLFLCFSDFCLFFFQTARLVPVYVVTHAVIPDTRPFSFFLLFLFGQRSVQGQGDSRNWDARLVRMFARLRGYSCAIVPRWHLPGFQPAQWQFPNRFSLKPTHSLDTGNLRYEAFRAIYSPTLYFYFI